MMQNKYTLFTSDFFLIESLWLEKKFKTKKFNTNTKGVNTNDEVKLNVRDLRVTK